MGLRRGEICGLSWKDIDFDDRIVDIGCAGGIRDKAGVSQSSASRHLNVLQRNGLPLSERHGK